MQNIRNTIKRVNKIIQDIDNFIYEIGTKIF
jgi:hypothetical protein